jgi:HSP90 family molecular chaperone
MLRKLAEEYLDNDDEENESTGKSAYIKFYEQFHKNLKMGLMEDKPNKSRLQKLIRFHSSHDAEGYTSLDQYVERMPDWQSSIYYSADSSIDSIEASPHFAKCKTKGVEVLYLIDPIDEYLIPHLADMDGKKFVHITKEGLSFGDEDEETIKKRTSIYNDQFEPLLSTLKTLYGEKVTKLSIASHVTAAPAVMVATEYGYSANMQRIVKAQTMGSNAHFDVLSRKIMELNPRHPIVVKLNEAFSEDASDEDALNLAWLMFDSACASSGFEMDDSDKFSERVNLVVQKSLGLDNVDLLPEVEIPEETLDTEEEVADEVELDDDDEEQVADEVELDEKDEL